MFAKICLLVLVVFLSFPSGFLAQQNFKTGAWELNLSGNMGSQSSKTKFEESGYSSESTSDHSYFQLHVIPGYYFVDGLSFEPELDFLFVKDTKPSYSLIPNISYTYQLPDNPKIALYARGGYGLSNAMNMFGVLFNTSSSLKVGIINLGAGIKFLATQNFCLRTEINYRRSSYTEEETFNFGYGTYSYKITNTLSDIRLLLGLSVIL